MGETRWVFGYGSLIWRPGFAFVGAQPARVEGAHRSLCVYSHHYRGTPERPGLVFGLRRGGFCEGMAFEVPAAGWNDVVAYLRAREQVTSVYLERSYTIVLNDGREVEALTYVADEAHEQFADLDDVDEQLPLVLQASGDAGSNVDYVLNTLAHLEEMGIHDPQLHELGQRLRDIAGR